jgi:hypothetical protein
LPDKAGDSAWSVTGFCHRREYGLFPGSKNRRSRSSNNAFHPAFPWRAPGHAGVAHATSAFLHRDQSSDLPFVVRAKRSYTHAYLRGAFYDPFRFDCSGCVSLPYQTV